MHTSECKMEAVSSPAIMRNGNANGAASETIALMSESAVGDSNEFIIRLMRIDHQMTGTSAAEKDTRPKIKVNLRTR